MSRFFPIRFVVLIQQVCNPLAICGIISTLHIQIDGLVDGDQFFGQQGHQIWHLSTIFCGLVWRVWQEALHWRRRYTVWTPYVTCFVLHIACSFYWRHVERTLWWSTEPTPCVSDMDSFLNNDQFAVTHNILSVVAIILIIIIYGKTLIVHHGWPPHRLVNIP